MTPFLLCSYFRAHPTTLLLKILGDGCMGSPPPQTFGGLMRAPPYKLRSTITRQLLMMENIRSLVAEVLRIPFQSFVADLSPSITGHSLWRLSSSVSIAALEQNPHKQTNASIHPHKPTQTNIHKQTHANRHTHKHARTHTHEHNHRFVFRCPPTVSVS